VCQKYGKHRSATTIVARWLTPCFDLMHITMHITGTDRNLSAAADSGDDRNLRSGRDGAGESTSISDILVPNENIDMLPHLALFGYEAISNSGVVCPEG